jgi:hypothetical protein
MSFLSSVNLSNAASMAALSVFPSTTRKFFCESGGGLTCYTWCQTVDWVLGVVEETHTHSSEEETSHGVLVRTRRLA